MPLNSRQLRKGLALLLLGAGLVGGLDALAFRLLRAGARTGDVARWTFSDWAPRQEALARWPHPPQVLFLGDSAMSRALRPSLITPEGFNLARTGLRVSELGELNVRLEAMGIRAPKLIVLSLMPEQFRPLESDLDFLDETRPGPASVLGAFYAEPQRSQLAFLPGTRVIRYRLEGWAKGRERNPDIEVQADGALRYRISVPDSHLHPTFPGFMKTAPGFMDGRRAELLRRFTARWEARGTRILWVKLPVHPDLHGPYLRRYEADFRYLNGMLEAQFPGGVIDLSEPLPPDCYWDATHLNNEGSDRLSRRLALLLAPRLEALGIPTAPGILGS